MIRHTFEITINFRILIITVTCARRHDFFFTLLGNFIKIENVENSSVFVFTREYGICRLALAQGLMCQCLSVLAGQFFPKFQLHLNNIQNNAISLS